MTQRMSQTKKFSGYAMMFLASFVMAFASGCASGGFKLTRKYAGFVNKQNIILRIVLYILTGVVFAVTLLIDMVVFNTMDFWDGRVSQGTYHFQKEGMQYAVHHRYVEGGLRESHIEVLDAHKKKVQDVLLKELPDSQIEIYINGHLRARVSDISSLPQVSVFDSRGQLKSTQALDSQVEWLAMK